MVHAGLAIAKITDDDTDEAAAVLDTLDEPQGADTL